MIKAARELKIRENAQFMYDMTGVVCAPHDQKYLESSRELWKQIRDDTIPEFKPERVKYDSAGNPTIPWKQAGHLMMSQLAVLKRLNGG